MASYSYIRPRRSFVSRPAAIPVWLLYRGLKLKTDYPDWDGLSHLNAFCFALEKRQTEMVRMMMEMDSNVRSTNEQFVKKAIQELIFFDEVMNPAMLELLLTGNPEASDLMGCFYMHWNQRRLATDYFYDRMSPMPPNDILIVCYLQTVTRKAEHLEIFLARAELRHCILGGLRKEEYFRIISLLIAQRTDVDYKLAMVVTEVMLDFSMISLKTMIDLMQMLISAQDSVSQSAKSYLDKAVKRVAGPVLRQFVACSEDMVSRLGALIDSIEAKDEILMNFLLNWIPLDGPIKLLKVVEFLIDQCHCDPNYKDRHGMCVLSVLLHLNVPNQLQIGPIVRFLLDHGAHPCSRVRSLGVLVVHAFDLFPCVGVPTIGVRTLQCIAASTIAEEQVEYEGRVPKKVCKFIELH